MKTSLLAGAAIATLAFNTFAAEPLLSPRAAGNQIKVVSIATAAPSATITYVDAAPAQLSPRAQATQTKVVKGIVSDSNPALVCRENMIASPRAVAECTSHTTMPLCVTVAPLK
jgi:hypothetical protein